MIKQNIGILLNLKKEIKLNFTLYFIISKIIYIINFPVFLIILEL
jgi:hypothetical protein